MGRDQTNIVHRDLHRQSHDEHRSRWYDAEIVVFDQPYDHEALVGFRLSSAPAGSARFDGMVSKNGVHSGNSPRLDQRTSQCSLDTPLDVSKPLETKGRRAGGLAPAVDTTGENVRDTTQTLFANTVRAGDTYVGAGRGRGVDRGINNLTRKHRH